MLNIHTYANTHAHSYMQTIYTLAQKQLPAVGAHWRRMASRHVFYKKSKFLLFPTIYANQRRIIRNPWLQTIWCVLVMWALASRIHVRWVTFEWSRGRGRVKLIQIRIFLPGWFRWSIGCSERRQTVRIDRCRVLGQWLCTALLSRRLHSRDTVSQLDQREFERWLLLQRMMMTQSI